MSTVSVVVGSRPCAVAVHGDAAVGAPGTDGACGLAEAEHGTLGVQVDFLHLRFFILFFALCIHSHYLLLPESC